MSTRATDQLLTSLQRQTFDYFLHESNPANGLVKDKTTPHWPASIAAVGLALAAYPIGVEAGFLRRNDARGRTLAALRFFQASHQGAEPDATGYKGFYYHFLDMQSGARAWQCELSTIDTTFLIAGMLTAAAYFTDDIGEEREIRELADALYRRVDWAWAEADGGRVRDGWKPESGFLPYRWSGYDEALLLYVLGLGSPTHPLSDASYPAWTAGYEWKQIYGYEYLYAGPLFTHQLSHAWIDFRGIQDAPMRNKGLTYFENSRRAAYIQQQYAIRNPEGWRGYGAECWGITASDGPGPSTREVAGVERSFFDYRARGAPFGPDDGTIAPWAVVASLPFAPEIVLPTIDNFERLRLRIDNPYGFKATYNPTFNSDAPGDEGWVSPYHFGLNQGPIVLMIANHRTGLLWELMKRCSYLETGLRRAGFTGGWLAAATPAEGAAGPAHLPAGSGRRSRLLGGTPLYPRGQCRGVHDHCDLGQ